MTNSDPVIDVLGSELLGFLNIYDFLTWDEGTGLWILMDARLMEEMLEILISAIVEDWMEDGITTMSEFETLKGMNLDEVVAMVEEQGEGLNWYI
ncbi:hypothetical protein BGX38DRAFT_1276810 [Terfezia claveryi]|nr:hypothetical protein BGX38DRAFT_1276810 [Terfezia claveryi]